MGWITATADTVFRDFNTDGNPSSGPWDPDKPSIRQLFALVDISVVSQVQGLIIGGSVIYSTLAMLSADLAHSAGTLGVVYNDPTVSNNGIYVKAGSSGVGSWSITNLALPASFAEQLTQIVAAQATSFVYTFSGSTGAADPGPGQLALSSATQSAASRLYIDDVNSDGQDLTAYINTLDGSTSTLKGYVRLSATADPTRWLLFGLTARVAGTGYQTLNLTSAAASATSPLVSGEQVYFSFIRNGDAGSTGPTGATGGTGATGLQGLQGPQGSPGTALNYKGTWNSSTAYNINDAVLYNGTCYYATAPNTNEAPTNTSYWALMVRQFINASTTYYVNGSTGSNTLYDGTSATVSGNHGPWQTPQYAVDWVTDNLFINNARVTIQLADGTYTESIQLRSCLGTFNPNPGSVGTDPGATFTQPTIRGNGATPSNVVIQSPGSNLAAIAAIDAGVTWAITNLEVTSADGTGSGILADFCSTLYVGNIVFNGLNSQLRAQWGSRIEVLNSMGITSSGTCASHVSAVTGGAVLSQGNNTLTLANPTFLESFALCENGGVSVEYGGFTTINGSATGTPVAQSILRGNSGFVDCPSIPGCLPGIVAGRQQVGNAIYYVNESTGNDVSYDGTSATVSGNHGPWQTPAHAYAWVRDNLDLGGYAVTIQLADGVYTNNPITASGRATGQTSPAGIQFLGNAASPSNVVISYNGGPVNASNGAQFALSGVTLQASGGSEIVASGIGTYILGNGPIHLGACAGAAVNAIEDAVVDFTSSYVINGSQAEHVNADLGGKIYVRAQPTATGTLAFTTFANAGRQGRISWQAATVSGGTITGQRYQSSSNGLIDTAGGGPNFFPGSTAGATATGGQYI